MLMLLIVQYIIDSSAELLLTTPFAVLLPAHNQVGSFASC